MAVTTATPRPHVAGLTDVTILVLGTGLLAALSATVRLHGVPLWERDLFTPTGLTPVLIFVMQVGSYPAVFVATGAAVILRRFLLAANVLLAGNLAYWLALAVKAAVARQRPAALLTDVVLREATTGPLGYPSGHVAVATALALVIARWRPPSPAS